MLDGNSREDIVVSSKTLGYISKGINRTPGAIIKELVYNAIDANATEVILSTNPPSFDIITCMDNGVGLTLEMYKKFVIGGIGSSIKRTKEESNLKFNRQVIGQFGFGLLGIAQVCHEFRIISHHSANETAFEGTLKLDDYLNEKIDHYNPSENREWGLKVGEFSTNELKFDIKKSGTRIIAHDMRSAFIRKFRENPGPPLPSKFVKFLDKIYRSKSLRNLGKYWEMVWDLSILCPVPYLRNGPIIWEQIDSNQGVKHEISRLKERTEHYNLKLVIDGMTLKKPILFPSPRIRKKDRKKMKGLVFPIKASSTPSGRPLKFSGYIYLQDGEAIVPEELRGLLVRIRDVAIGSYDSSLLRYPLSEGYRFGWVSGEIFIDEGLERAMNIDRVDFNELDSHYLKFQDFIHEKLKEIFKEARKRHRRKRADIKIEGIIIQLKDLISDFEIIVDNSVSKPLLLNSKKRTILVNTKNKLWSNVRQSEEVAPAIAYILDVSLQAPDKEREERFNRLIETILVFK